MREIQILRIELTNLREEKMTSEKGLHDMINALKIKLQDRGFDAFFSRIYFISFP